MFSYTENILRCASDAIQKPDDFGYWGSDDMFVTWGFCGIDKNRDSKILEETNFDQISAHLMSKYPDDFRIEGYRHWAVGHVDRLCVRVLKEDGEVSNENITDAFREAMNCKDQLEDYPIWDEWEYNSRLYLASIEVLDDLPFSIKRMINTDVEDWKQQIYIHLVDEMYVSFDPDADLYPNDDEILHAVYDIELWNYSEIEEWNEWTDGKQLESIESIIRNKNQLSLFD